MKQFGCILLMLAVTGVFFPVRAQHGIDETQDWLGISARNKINASMLLRSDAQLRWANGFKDWRIIGFRTGLFYFFKKHPSVSVAVGPTFFLSSRGGEFEWNKEYRLWEEIGKEWDGKHIKVSLKYRQEQRWMMNSLNESTFFHRFRFRNELFFKIPTPFNPDALAGVFLWNEWFVHQQKQLGLFNDQHRIYAGVQWRFAGFVTTQLQYIYFPFIRTATGKYNSRQAIRLSLNFDFK